MSVPDPVSAFAVPTSVRNLASLCDLARLVGCGHCFAEPHQPCNDVGDRQAGVHLARFARATRGGLVRSPEFALVLDLAGETFTSGTVIGGDPEIAPQASGPPGRSAHQQMTA